MSSKNRPAGRSNGKRQKQDPRRKDRRNKNRRAPRERPFSLSQVPAALIILAYMFGVTFTPNWMALDTNATKFLSLSVVNLLAFTYLVTRRDIREGPGVLMRFFTVRAGMAYAVFLVFALLSFTQATSITESLLHFIKLFSVLTAALVISVILLRDIRHMKMVIALGVVLLLIDSLAVFYFIGQYVAGELRSITDIKFVYSNKNILASAIFVKIPFAIYLWVFARGAVKKIGLAGIFAGILATFFLATRGFYVGTIVATLVFLVYCGYNYLRDRRREHLVVLGGYAVVLALAFALFSVVQSNLYPQRTSRHTQAVATQLATIQEDMQDSHRMNAWRWSAELIRENPLLGVGTGNWKISILEKENQHNTGYIYLYKTHNDFIENTVETGIFGGIAYVLLFVFIFRGLFRAWLRDDQGTRRYRYLFLAAFGMMFYGFDAFFNFPMDRPEIQMLFALYLALGIVVALLDQGPLPVSRKTKVAARFFVVFVYLVIVPSAWLFHMNYQSSRLQRVVYQEIMAGNLNEPSSRFVGQFPWMPAISIWGESMQVVPARYLIEEGKYHETIELLRGDHSNPHDGRREHFMAWAFKETMQRDSALAYASKAYEIKPYYFQNIHLLTNLLEHEERMEEGAGYLLRFLERQKEDAGAWLYASQYLQNKGALDKAWEVMEEAVLHHPDDARLKERHQQVHHLKFAAPYAHILREAAALYDAQDYENALDGFSTYLEKVPASTDGLRLRAFTHYRLGDHEAAMRDIEHHFATHGTTPPLMNLRGVCRRAMGDQEGACADFLAAKEEGNESGRNNYRRFCDE